MWGYDLFGLNLGSDIESQHVWKSPGVLAQFECLCPFGSLFQLPPIKENAEQPNEKENKPCSVKDKVVPADQKARKPKPAPLSLSKQAPTFQVGPFLITHNAKIQWCFVFATSFKTFKGKTMPFIFFWKNCYCSLNKDKPSQLQIYCKWCAPGNS